MAESSVKSTVLDQVLAKLRLESSADRAQLEKVVWADHLEIEGSVHDIEG